MTDRPAPADGAAAQAAFDLAAVQAQVEAAQALLVRLLQEVVVAESRLDNSQLGQLMSANEQLVIAALRSQADADTATMALDEAARSTDLDALTGLPNRTRLLDRLTLAIAGARRHHARLALLFLDLDDFKRINDTLGHAAGDTVLQQVAQRLLAAVREQDTVSRHGGDEFLILLSEVSQPSDAALIAAKLAAAVAAPCSVGGQTLRVQASIGISLYPDDGTTAQQLIDRADAAMYLSKRQGASGPGGAGDVAAEEVPVAPPPAWPAPHPAPAAAAADRRHADLREANQRLVLAALGAQALQDAAERAQRRQAELLEAVTQELRNPMAPIRLATAMLGRARTDEPLLPRVQALMAQQLAQMQRLVGGVQEVAQATTRASGNAPARCDLRPVIAAATSACQSGLDARRQVLVLDLPAGAVSVAAPADDLLLMLGNLLDNASRFSGERGEIRLSVALQGTAAVLTVADHGIGITAQALPRIFDPFMQDSLALGLGSPGPGIGLTVVRTLAEALGGHIHAHSAGRGCGSVFELTLPLAAAPGPDAADIRR